MEVPDDGGKELDLRAAYIFENVVPKSNLHVAKQKRRFRNGNVPGFHAANCKTLIQRST
ncbi:hypothetical protein ACLOJK_004717 [Asimina triloba]